MQNILFYLLLVIIPLLFSCGGGSGNNENQPIVRPLYSINGANWNDYIKDDGTSFLDSTAIACNSSTDSSCLHGGEIRLLEIPERVSCTGLSAEDSLGAFEWICDDSDGFVQIVSTGLKLGKGLSDLIDFDAVKFKDNSVEVLDGGVPFYNSPPEIWWGNTVKVSNNGSDGSDINSGEVHLVTQNVNATYWIKSSQVAFLIKPGVVLSGTANTDENVIYSSEQDYLWLEGTVDAYNDSRAIFLISSDFSVIRKVNTINANMYGIELINSTRNNLTGIDTNGNLDGTGIRLELYSNNNMLSGISANGNRFGIYLSESSNNHLSDINASENSITGLTLASSSDNNLLFNITTYQNSNSGVSLFSSSDNSIVNITTSDNSNYGLSLNSSLNNFINNAVASGNYGSGVFLYTSSNNNTLSNISSTDNSNGVGLNNSSNNTFTGKLEVGNNTYETCYVTGGTDPGLIDVSCMNQGSSDAILNVGISTVYSFFDAPNGDYSLASTDTIIRDVLSQPNGNNNHSHTWSDSSHTEMLRNSIEIQDDGVGNDNLLCESNETCLYTPNIAAYQGHGNLVSAGTFTDGTIAGVTLLEYETNGY